MPEKTEETKPEAQKKPGEIAIDWPGKLTITANGERFIGARALSLHDSRGSKAATELLNEWAAANPRAIVVWLAYDSATDAMHLVYTYSLTQVQTEELDFVNRVVQRELDKLRADKLDTAASDAEAKERARLTEQHFASVGRSYVGRVKNIEAMEKQAILKGAKKKGKGQDPDVRDAWDALHHGWEETVAEKAFAAAAEARAAVAAAAEKKE